MQENSKELSILSDYQYDAVDKMKNGCILNGGVGSGKSRTGIYYYFKEQGGSYIGQEYIPMTNPKDLYIITTAKKRDSKEFEDELIPFRLRPDKLGRSVYGNKVTIDSWNNIKKYTKIYDAFFIFDEDKVTGYGAWVKAFLNITRKNNWIILSATPGDDWMQYLPVFIANGFYRNKRDFTDQHVIYSPYTTYPKIQKWINVPLLIKHRKDILVPMSDKRKTISDETYITTDFDKNIYKFVTKNRWDIYNDCPIETASRLCMVWREIVNTDDSRQAKLLELYENNPKMIIFYNYNYELDILKNLYYGKNVKIAQWNARQHDEIPKSSKWVYLVQYNSCEGWNCITTDCIVFYSLNYSYKIMEQARGRIDRMNTPYIVLHYYYLTSKSPIDLAIMSALRNKKIFNESIYLKSRRNNVL